MSNKLSSKLIILYHGYFWIGHGMSTNAFIVSHHLALYSLSHLAHNVYWHIDTVLVLFPRWPDDAWHKNVEKLGGRYERREGEDNQAFVAFRSRAGGSERQSQGGQGGTKIRTDCTEHFSSAESPLLSSPPMQQHSPQSSLLTRKFCISKASGLQGVRAYHYENLVLWTLVLRMHSLRMKFWTTNWQWMNGYSNILTPVATKCYSVYLDNQKRINRLERRINITE